MPSERSSMTARTLLLLFALQSAEPAVSTPITLHSSASSPLTLPSLTTFHAFTAGVTWTLLVPLLLSLPHLASILALPLPPTLHRRGMAVAAFLTLLTWFIGAMHWLSRPSPRPISAHACGGTILAAAVLLHIVLAWRRPDVTQLVGDEKEREAWRKLHVGMGAGMLLFAWALLVRSALVFGVSKRWFVGFGGVVVTFMLLGVVVGTVKSLRLGAVKEEMSDVEQDGLLEDTASEPETLEDGSDEGSESEKAIEGQGLVLTERARRDIADGESVS